jgi:hypothetical protein
LRPLSKLSSITILAVMVIALLATVVITVLGGRELRPEASFVYGASGALIVALALALR